MIVMKKIDTTKNEPAVVQAFEETSEALQVALSLLGEKEVLIHQKDQALARLRTKRQHTLEEVETLNTKLAELLAINKKLADERDATVGEFTELDERYTLARRKIDDLIVLANDQRAIANERGERNEKLCTSLLSLIARCGGYPYAADLIAEIKKEHGF